MLTCRGTKILAGLIASGLVIACSSSDTGTPSGQSSGPVSFSPSNLNSFLATLDLTGIQDIDVTGTSNELSVSCNSAACVAAKVTLSDGSTAQVYVAKSWKIEPGGLLPVTDSLPVIVVATGTISILGHLDASATQQFTHAGGYLPANPGPGVGGAGMNGTQTSTGIGAGGASFCGLGGIGGASTATNGLAGKAYGAAKLIPLMGGSAGGLGDLAPGAGGGAIELVAGVSIDVGAQGLVSVGGGGGGDGTSTGSYSASGGGSGGSLLLEAPTVSIEGALAANGGGGGGGSGGPSNGADSTGAAAAIGGAAGTTGAGGNGSAGAATAGGAGGAGDAVGGNSAPGAGGGGAGWIRINTKSGAAAISGTLSPAAGTSCVTQGTLAP